MQVCNKRADPSWIQCRVYGTQIQRLTFERAMLSKKLLNLHLIDSKSPNASYKRCNQPLISSFTYSKIITVFNYI